MITINIYLRIHAKESTDGVVWVKFYVNREKVNFSTGIHVKEKQWNATKSKVMPYDVNHADKNLILENICARINDVMVKFRLRNKVLTREAFLRAYHRPDDFATFFEFAEHISPKINFRNEDSTMQTHKKMISKLKGYNAALHLDDITPEWLSDYLTYLIKEHKNCLNTAYKDLSTLRKYVNAATEAGYLDKNPFLKFTIKRIKTKITFLEEEEISDLMQVYRRGVLSLPYHKTLEFFLFMCFSSLHVSDARAMMLEQFGNESFTYYRVKLRNRKPEPVVVPLSGALAKIIVNIVGTRRKGLIFEKMPADQTMNGYLKEIAAMVGITKNISHKTGRHTFGTFYYSKTLDIVTLKEIMGHSDIRETLTYVHAVNQAKKDGIKAFDMFE